MSERPQLEDSRKFWQKLVNVGLEDGFFPIVSSELPQKQTLVIFCFFSWILFIFGAHVYIQYLENPLLDG